MGADAGIEHGHLEDGRRRGSKPAVRKSRMRTAQVRFRGSRGLVTAPGYPTRRISSSVGGRRPLTR